MVALELKGLRKYFGKIHAVDDLSLKVPEGCVYGFLGPNGAGKTTTIKMITGLSEPTDGTIEIFGQKLHFGSSLGRTNIGYLPDVPEYYAWMKPVEFLKFCGDLYKIDHKALKSRIEELLDLVGLGEVNRRIGGFSRGMKQRLGIAQALINNPRLVLLDEPASALDPIGRKDVMDIISRLSGKTTVFFSTHILADVERVCDRIAIVHKGRLVTEDTMDSLRKRYALKEIEMELSSTEAVDNIIRLLSNESWFDGVKSVEGQTMVISVKDQAVAGVRLPILISSVNAGLLSLRNCEPTLEDIFMEAVK